MPQRVPAIGSLVIAARRPSSPAFGSVLDVLRTLRDRLDHHHLPATWALADPNWWPELGLAGQGTGAELALLLAIPPEGMGKTETVAAQLHGLVPVARRVAPSPQTLVLANPCPLTRLDVLVRYRIRFVVTAVTQRSAWQGVRPESRRFGIWQWTPCGALPPESWWQWWRWSRQLRRAIWQGGLYLWRIEVPAEAAPNRRWWRQMDRSLAALRQYLQRGELQMGTVGTVLGRLSRPPVLSRQRSVLRKAA